MVKFLPDGTMKLSGGVNQVIPGSTTQSFADQVEDERTGINFSGPVQDRLRQSGGFFGDVGQVAKDAYKGMSSALMGSYGIDPDHLSRSHKVNKLALSGFFDFPENLGPEIYGAKLKAKDFISSQSDPARLTQQVSPFIPPLSALAAVAAPFYQAGTELPRSAWRPDINVVDALQAVAPQTIGNWSGLANKDLDTTRIIDDQIMKNVLRVPQPTAQEQPINLGQTHADTLQSFFNIPSFDLEPDLNLKPSVISPPEGSVAPYQGPVEWDYTPSREDWNEADAFTVQDDAEASLYPIGTTTGSLLEEPSAENLNTILMNTLVPMEGITETVESLPSGPEEMTEVFTEEDKIAEDERIRLDKIMTKAREDRIAQEKIAADARQAKEADERRARELREEAARAEDRQDKARLSREAKERDRQAQERAQEERNAAEAARLNSLAEAADKMAIDQARKQQEEQARKQAEFNKQHEAFVKQMDRDWRARQQASMPKSWAFF